MSEVILRIFFCGLMVFVPSKDGKELTVLVVNGSHTMKLSDGTPLPNHLPILLARAGSCEPAPCPARDSAIAQFLFSGKSTEKAADALQAALAGGGAWQLSSSDLSLPAVPAPLEILTNARGRTATGAPNPVPTSAAERADFSWVPHLTDIVPGIGEIRPELLGEHPPGALVAARLRLRSGSVITYSMIRVDGKVRPLHFRASESSPDVPYAQALANWEEAEIHVRGDVVEIVDTNFETGATRTMKLHGQGKVVEMALLNLPPFMAPAAGAKPPLPKPGRHFELYYDLMTTPPENAKRPIPQLPRKMNASDPQVDWASLHPRQALWSDLLEQLGMSPRGKKGPYDLALCPGSQFP